MSYKYGMFPFPAVFALKNACIHIGSSNSSDISTNGKVSVYEHFSFCTILEIPNVNPYDSHV